MGSETGFLFLDATVGVWRPNPYQQRRRKPLTGAPPVSFETITGLYLTRCRGLATTFLGLETKPLGLETKPLGLETKPLGLETKPLLFVPPGRAIPGFAWAAYVFLQPQ
jgi:hypothetical protein